jgi:poly(A) polymerase
MDARQAIEAVSAVVSPVFLVGGSVRDALMGRACEDYDFATPLDPEAVEALVKAAGRRAYLVGKRFGTIGFRVDGHVVEVTTFRSERYAERSRRPSVEFEADLVADLGRRDFTINAMALDGAALVDPFGGESDIEARTVRAVGHAEERFAEDPLRMLRAARFASQLDFAVEPQTAAAVANMAPRILDVARERWMLELDRLLVGPAAARGLRLLADSGLLRYLLPELSLQTSLGWPADSGAPTPDATLFDRTLAGVTAAERDATKRWAALLRDVGLPFAAAAGDGAPGGDQWLIGAEIVERTALYLKWSTRRRESVVALVRGNRD